MSVSRIACLILGAVIVLCITHILRLRPHRSTEATIEEIGRICVEHPDDCFVVSDFVDWNRKEAWRMLRSEKSTENSEAESHFSRVALKHQNDSTSSREWAIDHTVILAQYLAVMVTFPFALDALPSPYASIFSIGLGGGVLDMFLHTQRPHYEITVVELQKTVVDIGHEWFGVQETPKRKTEIADGIVFLADAVKNGRQVDVIFVDACNLTNREVTCPPGPFTERKNVAGNGAVIVNVASRAENAKEKHFRKVLDALFFFFPMCLKAEMASGNVVLACVKTAHHANDENALRDVFTTRWNAAAKEFALRDILAGVNITVIIKDQ